MCGSASWPPIIRPVSTSSWRPSLRGLPEIAPNRTEKKERSLSCGFLMSISHWVYCRRQTCAARGSPLSQSEGSSDWDLHVGTLWSLSILEAVFKASMVEKYHKRLQGAKLSYNLTGFPYSLQPHPNCQVVVRQPKSLFFWGVGFPSPPPENYQIFLMEILFPQQRKTLPARIIVSMLGFALAQ